MVFLMKFSWFSQNSLHPAAGALLGAASPPRRQIISNPGSGKFLEFFLNLPGSNLSPAEPISVSSTIFRTYSSSSVDSAYLFEWVYVLYVPKSAEKIVYFPPDPGFEGIFRLGREASPGSAPAAGSSELCENHEKFIKNTINVQGFYFFRNKT